LNQRESGRWKTAGPALGPIHHPTRFPAIAATGRRRSTSHSGATNPPATSSPAVNKQRVAGQEEPDQKAALGEHDRHHAHETERVDQMHRIEESAHHRDARGPELRSD
jgi:hypothetical protein